MRVPFKRSMLQYHNSWPTCIVIHHTIEFIDDPKVAVLNQKAQSQIYENLNYLHTKRIGTKYHYLIEASYGDFQATVSQPLMTVCDYKDLTPEYDRAVHIGIIGSCITPPPIPRLYQVLAFKVIGPLMRVFYLTEDRIFLHKEISDNKECTCPGYLFSKSKLLAIIRSMQKRTPVTRG